jgi:acetolactate synthase I/II/III large subunit
VGVVKINRKCNGFEEADFLMGNGGQAVVKALQAQGVERVFCVAGESYLPVLDALVDAPDIGVVTCRHESGAAFMAEAYGLLHTGRPGVVMVTRGPGACNASIGIHAAKQSSSPVVMFVGLIGTGERDREAFQEFDLPQMFGSHTKWAAVIDRPERLSEYIARAFHVATSGRPGPVVLGLPEDVLNAAVENAEAAPIVLSPPVPRPADVAAVLEVLQGAQRPLVIAGGPGWSDAQCGDLASFARAAHLPVAASFRRQDLVDHRMGCYVGELGTGPNPQLVEAASEADVIIALGTRLGEITAQGYTLPRAGQRVIHIPMRGSLGNPSRLCLRCRRIRGRLPRHWRPRGWTGAHGLAGARPCARSMRNGPRSRSVVLPFHGAART